MTALGNESHDPPGTLPSVWSKQNTWWCTTKLTNKNKYIYNLSSALSTESSDGQCGMMAQSLTNNNRCSERVDDITACTSIAEQNIFFWWGNIPRMQWLGQLLHANVSVDKTLSCTKLLTCARVGRWLLVRGILFDKLYRIYPLHHTYHTHFFMNMLLDWRMSFRQMFSISLFLVRYEPCQGFYHTHPVYFETQWQWRVS